MVKWLNTLHPWEVAEPLRQFALAHPVGSGLVIAFLQVIVGVLTVLGCWQRVAAVIGAGLSAALLLTVSWKSVPAYDAPDIIYLAAWSPLIIAGAPVYSVDGRLAGGAWRRLGPRADLWDLRRYVLRRGALAAFLVTGVTLLVGSLLGGAVRDADRIVVPGPGESPRNELPGSPLPQEPGERRSSSPAATASAQPGRDRRHHRPRRRHGDRPRQHPRDRRHRHRRYAQRDPGQHGRRPDPRPGRPRRPSRPRAAAPGPPAPAAAPGAAPPAAVAAAPAAAAAAPGPARAAATAAGRPTPAGPAWWGACWASAPAPGGSAPPRPAGRRPVPGGSARPRPTRRGPAPTGAGPLLSVCPRGVSDAREGWFSGRGRPVPSRPPSGPSRCRSPASRSPAGSGNRRACAPGPAAGNVDRSWSPRSGSSAANAGRRKTYTPALISKVDGSASMKSLMCPKPSVCTAPQGSRGRAQGEGQRRRPARCGSRPCRAARNGSKCPRWWRTRAGPGAAGARRRTAGRPPRPRGSVSTTVVTERGRSAVSSHFCSTSARWPQETAASVTRSSASQAS
ncbi:hypothetical protein SFUMM280S_03136 [Streptomyces fumanus]